jgi:PQQ-dependent dehydrogenase (s-GDH family)
MKLIHTFLAAALVLPFGIGTAMAATDDPSNDAADAATAAKPPATQGDFTPSIVATELSDPFEIMSTPDGMLWVTERTAGRLTRIDPSDGSKWTALTIPDVVATPGEQDGLLGAVPHPDLLAGKGNKNAYIYLSYTYDGDPDPAVLDRRQRIARYTYDKKTATFGSPEVLIENLLASDDHNSGRLRVGPDSKLYYTIGDRGNNQDLNACRLDEAQRLPTAEEIDAGDWTAYQGKTLRLNLDGSIPEDNPKFNGVRSHILTYGHRNAQGLVFGTDGKLYSSEQGPKSDDELNLLVAGGNYGWPNVAGYKDDSSYVYGNWSAQQNPPCDAANYNAFEIPESVPQLAESTFNAPDFVPPLRTFYTVQRGFDFRGEPCEPSGLFFICYPTIAPSSLDIYTNNSIPGWENSLLMPTLKDGTLYRMPILGDGTVIDGPLPLFTSVNRYRDTAISQDGTSIYVATDSGGLARGENGDATSELQNPGSIIEFRYTPSD